MGSTTQKEGKNMKKFENLNGEQKKKAKEFAVKELKSCIDMGLIVYNTYLTEEFIEKEALTAASGSLYTDDGSPILHIGEIL